MYSQEHLNGTIPHQALSKILKGHIEDIENINLNEIIGNSLDPIGQIQQIVYQLTNLQKPPTINSIRELCERQEKKVFNKLRETQDFDLYAEMSRLNSELDLKNLSMNQLNNKWSQLQEKIKTQPENVVVLEEETQIKIELDINETIQVQNYYSIKKEEIQCQIQQEKFYEENNQECLLEQQQIRDNDQNQYFEQEMDELDQIDQENMSEAEISNQFFKKLTENSRENNLNLDQQFFNSNNKNINNQGFSSNSRRIFDCNYIQNLMSDEYNMQNNFRNESWGNVLRDIDINEPFNCKFLDDL